MGEGSNRTSNGAGNRGLETRLEALEQALASAAGNDAELQLLKEAVQDLAADSLDLRNQMEKIVSSCERLLAGGGGEVDFSSARRNGLRGSASTLRRVTGRAVRGTIGAARRLMGGRDSGREVFADLDLRLSSSPARELPGIAVVIRTEDDIATVVVPEEIRAQSVPDVKVVMWNEVAGTAARFTRREDRDVFDAPDRKVIADELTADFVAELAAPLPRLHPTIFEVCGWTLASEGLPLIVQSGGSAPEGEKAWPIRPVAAWAAAEPETSMIKVVGGRHWHPMGFGGVPMIGAGSGCGYLPAPGVTGSVTHEAAPLTGVVSSVASSDKRPTVVLTTTARGAPLVAWLQRLLGEDFRFIVISVDHEDSSGSAIRAITDLGATVYPLAGYLDPSVHPSLVNDVVRAYGAETLLRIDAPVDLQNGVDEGPRVIDLPFHLDEISADADLVLALGSGIADRARQQEIETVDLVAAPDLPAAMPAADAVSSLRSAYSIPEDARLVLTIGDLTPDRRPEDVAAVARRLHRHENIFFLVIGRGPLAGTVSDLAGYFGLDRFILSPGGHSVTDLVAACDCVLSPAEEDPWPAAVAAGLALGRSVIATDVDGVRELVAAADGDRCTLCRPGDVDGMAAAVADGLENHRKQRTTKKAWTAARARSKRCFETIREVLGRNIPDGAETS